MSDRIDRGMKIKRKENQKNQHQKQKDRRDERKTY